jgi:alpha-ketoglutarate-dependent taurine dioxygenase
MSTGDHASSTRPLQYRPASGHIGAEISGVDLRRPLDDAEVAAIRATLLEWKMVFFRDQFLTEAQYVAFGRQFGEVLHAHPSLPVSPDHPEIVVLKRVEDSGFPGLTYDRTWHADVTYEPEPPIASILRAIEVPEYGGDTQWVNLVTAYEHLSPEIRALVDTLHAVHHNETHIARGDFPPGYVHPFAAKDYRAVHPVVRVHPESGQKALFVNPGYTTHIVELSRRESKHLLAMLFEHMLDPAFSVRLRWEPGTIAFWDNRATMHRAPSDVPRQFGRTVQQMTLAGEPVRGADGSTSYAL